MLEEQCYIRGQRGPSWQTPDRFLRNVSKGHPILPAGLAVCICLCVKGRKEEMPDSVYSLDPAPRWWLLISVSDVDLLHSLYIKCPHSLRRLTDGGKTTLAPPAQMWEKNKPCQRGTHSYTQVRNNQHGIYYWKILESGAALMTHMGLEY